MSVESLPNKEPLKLTDEGEFVPLVMKPGLIRRLSQSGWLMERFYRSNILETRNDSRRKIVPRSDIFSAVAPQMNTLTGRRILNTTIDTLMKVTGDESLASTHGGSTAQTILAGDRFNGPEILRTYSRVPNSMFTQSEPGSEIPYYEKLAAQVRRRLSFPNIEFTLPHMTRSDFSRMQAAIATKIEKALEKNNHRVTRHTDTDGTTHLVTPFDPYIFNTTHNVLGYIRTDRHDIYDREKVVFPFVPITRPDHVDISVKQIHPQGNPDWTILRTQFACRDEYGQNIDVVDVFAKPLPRTADEKTRDDRMGWVPNTQLAGDIWHKDGRVSVPPRKQLFAEPRMHPKSFIHKSLGSLAVAWTRILRGEAIKNTFTYDALKDRRFNFPDDRPEAIHDMQRAAERMVELYNQGQRYADPIGKRVELGTDNVIALHYNPYVAFRTWKLAIPWDHYSRILPHMPLRHLSTGATKQARDGTSLIYYPWKDELNLSSGIPGRLYHVQSELEKRRFEWETNWGPAPNWRLPKGSPIAQSLWMTDLFPDE